MNQREREDIDSSLLQIFCGLLFDFQTFRRGEPFTCSFDFDHPIYGQLRARYPIERVAGKGGAFERALRLVRWLSPKLVHRGDYELSAERRTVPQNALALLEFSFEKPEHGINCAAKSLILTACCLALGIYARRVSLYPASPYDDDNHVVTEIYDKKRGKWIMLDPSVGGYVSDGTEPLSVLELRERFAKMLPVSVVFPRQDPRNIDLLSRRNHEINTYYAKNLFYIAVELHSSPEGDRDECHFIPEGFDVCARMKQNADYFVRLIENGNADDAAAEACRSFREFAEAFRPRFGTPDLWDPPV